jgi:hypothetical protein
VRFPCSLLVSSGAAGVVSIARIERPPLHRGGSASTETIPAVSPLPFRACRSSLLEDGLFGLPLRASEPLILSNDPSKLNLPLSLGMAPVVVPLRPSSEHILIVRAPGARVRHGCHSTPFIVRVLRARRMAWLFPPPPSKLACISLQRVAWSILKCARRGGTIKCSFRA